MRIRPFSIVAVAFVVLLPWLSWSTAAASPLTYLSQTGLVRASGFNVRLGGSSLNVPISGLSDVNEALVVSDSVPPDAYESRAELTTSLGATQLALDGFTSASVEGCSYFELEEGLCGGGSDANATITFALSVPAFSHIEYHWTPGTHNGPYSVLTHATLGFVLAFDQYGWGVQQCGSLDFDACMALGDLFYSGTVLPGGEYELEFILYAWIPTGSCAVGCHDAGGGMLFSVVPEPATGALLSAGLVALGLSRRRRTTRGLGPSKP